MRAVTEGGTARGLASGSIQRMVPCECDARNLGASHGDGQDDQAQLLPETPAAPVAGAIPEILVREPCTAGEEAQPGPTDPALRADARGVGRDERRDRRQPPGAGDV